MGANILNNYRVNHIDCVYVDGLFYMGSGIGRYYSVLVKELIKKNISVYTSVPVKYKENFEKEFFERRNLINVNYVTYERFSMLGMLLQTKYINFIKNKVQCYFYPHINIPVIFPKNTIVVVHDIRFLTEHWDRSLIKKYIFKGILNRVIKKASKIVVVSNYMKQMIVTYSKCIENKVIVSYNNIDKIFSDSEKKEPLPMLIDKIPYILYVGNRKKHKNLIRLIDAFEILKKDCSCCLVIAGSNDDIADEIKERINQKGYASNIIEIYHPSDEALLSLYDNASAFIFPSLYEGFGIPPIEAMARGCPVIASNIPAVKEVCEDCAIYFDPYSIDDIAFKIRYALFNSNISSSNILKGIKRTEYFKNGIDINKLFEII